MKVKRLTRLLGAACILMSGSCLCGRSNGYTLSRLHEPFAAGHSASEINISPDGKWVVFIEEEVSVLSPTSYRPQPLGLYSASLTGGPLARLDDVTIADQYISYSDRPFSTDGQSVAFTTFIRANNTLKIFKANLDGSATTLISPHDRPASDSVDSLKLSASGTHIVYKSHFLGDVVSVPVDGGSSKVISPTLGPGEINHHHYFSQLHDRILFVHGSYPQGMDLYSVKPDGSDLVNLSISTAAGVDESVMVNSVNIYSSSDYVLYSSNKNLYSVPYVGGIPVQLNAPSNDYYVLDGRISPLGDRVVMHQWPTAGGEFDFVSVPIAGGTPIRLNRPLQSNQRLGFSVLFTPDNSTFIYALETHTAQGLSSALFSVPLAGGEPVQLAASKSDFYRGMVLSPDGSTLAYVVDHDADGACDLFLLSLAGGDPVRVNDPLPDLADVSEMHFSPDGRWIAFHSIDEIDGSYSSYIASVDTSSQMFDVGRPTSVSGSVNESNFVTLLSGGRALLQVGNAFTGRELYLLQIPEPTTLAIFITAVFLMEATHGNVSRNLYAKCRSFEGDFCH